jgi:hypothetical protein
MFNERGIKEAFDRVKEDIFNLSSEVSSIKTSIFELKQLFSTLNDELSTLKLKHLNLETTCNNQVLPTDNPTDTRKYSTVNDSPTDNPTVPHEIGGLKSQFSRVSMRNQGVPTDRQTNQQTDNPTDFAWNKGQESSSKSPKNLHEQILNATEILNSLDNLRKEIRLKFKTITNQEMLVFSTIYELEQTYKEGVEYDQIALKLKLSSSSIRDYVQRLINKGVPILKDKINNKKILLKISNELKKIATLDTIIKLRGL